MVPGYREVRQLGAGRTGRVFLATYQSTGAYVAIKYLNATLRRDPEFMDRYRADAHQLVELDDPNIVRLYEYVETPARAAVVMELVDGVSLRTLLAEHGRTAPEAALVLLKGILAALAAAHEKGVPHRDVKPENVLVQADGTSKLADFGVVVHAEEPGVPAGSPAYMSPELWTQGRAGPPADLYAAACVLFEAVRGRPPYRAYKEDGNGGDGEQDVAALRDLHLTAPVPLEVVPDALRDLLRRGLAKDPATRYASARQFAAELEEDAVAGYGPGWEQRGRRRLAELATLLALRFPLAARTEQDARVPAGIRGRAVRLPALPPHLWVAGATVVAVAIALVISGGRLSPGAGTILMPQPKPPGELNSAPVDAHTPTPRRSVPATARGSASPPAPTGGPRVPTGPAAPTSAAPPPVPPTVPTTAPPTVPPTVPTTVPTRAQSGTALPPPAVREASIARWSGSAGAIRVSADGTGPVRLRIAYTRRLGDGPVTTVRRETLTLRGSTAYTSGVRHDPGSVDCGVRAYLGIVVMTEPAAVNGPQVSEVAVDGPACTVPPTRSAPPTPTGTASPTDAASPTGGQPVAHPTSGGTPPVSSPPVAHPTPGTTYLTEAASPAGSRALVRQPSVR
ncbi:protein kinase [Nonomuraea sp. NPDC001831]|uniref:protein kinase domain-containing protein n=1 Tax=Nonomuraea sp. NPDC001831 TaxID=3364340 RepID=UPI0036C92488